MEFLRRVRVAWFIGALLAVAVLIAGCAPDANSEIISPELGERMIAAASSEMVVAAEPTPAPTIADLSPEEILAGLPDEMAAAISSGTPSNGETLALTNGCVGCHALDPETQMTGPTWYDVADTAVSRVPGESPGFYLYTSIAAPNDHLVEGYPQGIMPQTYIDTLSTQDFGDLVAYLLTQHVE